MGTRKLRGSFYINNNKTYGSISLRYEQVFNFVAFGCLNSVLNFAKLTTDISPIFSNNSHIPY